MSALSALILSATALVVWSGTMLVHLYGRPLVVRVQVMRSSPIVLAQQAVVA